MNTSLISFEQLSEALNSINSTESLNGCEKSFPFSNSSLEGILENLEFLDENLDQALELSSCSNLSPLFRFFSSGSICTESISGLNILFSLMLAVSIMTLIMLTTRAALFNPVIRAKRIKRREKEFDEYRNYMKKYYDTDSWKMDPPKSFDSTIECFSTMDSDDNSLRSVVTSSNGAASDANCSGVQQSDEAVNVTQLSQCPNDRLILSSSTSFFAFRKHQLYHKDVEVIYYSSDSDSEDDESVSISLNSSISTLSALIWKGSGRTPVSHRKGTLDIDEPARTDAEPRSMGNIPTSTIRQFMTNTSQAIQIPFNHRIVTRVDEQEPNEHKNNQIDDSIPQHERSTDPTHLGNPETCLDDSTDTAINNTFVDPPTPPDAPQKKFNAVARTSGARTID